MLQEVREIWQTTGVQGFEDQGGKFIPDTYLSIYNIYTVIHKKRHSFSISQGTVEIFST